MYKSLQGMEMRRLKKILLWTIGVVVAGLLIFMFRDEIVYDYDRVVNKSITTDIRRNRFTGEIHTFDAGNYKWTNREDEILASIDFYENELREALERQSRPEDEEGSGGFFKTRQLSEDYPDTVREQIAELKAELEELQ